MSEADLINHLKAKATKLRRHILTMASNGQMIHLGGSMSLAEIMAVLVFHYLDLEGKKGPKDHLILSKGHTVHVFHACLAELGLVNPKEFTTLAQMGTRLAGHPSRKAPLVEVATGSLGHGLSVGIGLALAERLDKTNAKTVVIMGDGEIQEGSVWEAALSAPRFELNNLLAVVDCNTFQSTGPVKDILPLDPLQDKWESFGWNTVEIDGHDIPTLLAFLETLPAPSVPTMILAKTIKGKGVPAVEGKERSHFVTLKADQVEEALKGLEIC